MKTTTSSTSGPMHHIGQTPASSQAIIRDLLTNEILLSIFDKVSLVHRKRLSRVCKHWKDLIDMTFRWVLVFSAVDDRRCISDWQPSNWLGIQFVNQNDYLRIPKISASDLLSRIACYLPNLRAIDLECCDMNSRIIRTILTHCKKVERINLDSSIRLNYYSFNLMVQDWSNLRHINLSCCSEVSEMSTKFLIQKLDKLESLNLCGTKIIGLCLDQLNYNLKRLDISYCWGVQEAGLTALSRAKCLKLEELSVNNFDFDGSESCLIALCNQFTNLKHLQMSIGPCVAHDYFIDRLSSRGFSTIGTKLHQLETLIIEKICILDNSALNCIIRNCRKLKRLRLNLGWLNYCNDTSFAEICKHLLQLEELYISYPSALSCQLSFSSLNALKQLKSLTLINTDIDDTIFKKIDLMDQLNELNFDDCRKITIKGLYHMFRIAHAKPMRKFKISFLGTGIDVNRVKKRRNFPKNVIGHISEFRSAKCLMQLPPVPTPRPVTSSVARQSTSSTGAGAAAATSSTSNAR